MSSSSTSPFWQPKKREKTGKGHDEGGLGISTVSYTPVSISNQHESDTEVPEHCRASSSQLAGYAPKYQHRTESTQHPSCPQHLPNNTRPLAITSSKEQARQQSKFPGLLTVYPTPPPIKSYLKFKLYKQKKNPSTEIFLMQRRSTKYGRSDEIALPAWNQGNLSNSLKVSPFNSAILISRQLSIQTTQQHQYLHPYSLSIQRMNLFLPQRHGRKPTTGGFALRLWRLQPEKFMNQLQGL